MIDSIHRRAACQPPDRRPQVPARLTPQWNVAPGSRLIPRWTRLQIAIQLKAGNTLPRPVLIAGPRAVSWHLTAAVLDTAASGSVTRSWAHEVRNYRCPEKYSGPCSTTCTTTCTRCARCASHWPAGASRPSEAGSPPSADASYRCGRSCAVWCGPSSGCCLGRSRCHPVRGSGAGTHSCGLPARSRACHRCPGSSGASRRCRRAPRSHWSWLRPCCCCRSSWWRCALIGQRRCLVRSADDGRGQDPCTAQVARLFMLTRPRLIDLG
jgi:hypothetical protein